VCRIRGPCTIFSTVTRWFNEFQRGRQSLEDNIWSGRPSDAVSPSVIAAVENNYLWKRGERRYWKSWEQWKFYVEVLKLLFMTIWRFLRYLHDGYQELPRSLTAQDRGAQSHVISRVLGSLHVWPRQVYTAYCYWRWNLDSECKQESMQWRHALFPPLRKFITQPAGKIISTIFWDNKGVLLVDYLPDKSTINRQYYANLLLKLLQAIKDKRRVMLTRGAWLVHESSPVHKSTLPSKLFATIALYS